MALGPVVALLVAQATWSCAPPEGRAVRPPVEASAQQETQPTRSWTGPTGEPLPYTTGEEILAFLRDAEIVGVKPIPEGVAAPRVVTLEADGIRARAAFHHHHVVRERQRLVDGTVVRFFRDSYLNQPAADEVARLLGLYNTPPTVVREVEGTTGSLQLWVEHAMTERERRDRGIRFPDRVAAYRQVYDMDVFDALINNRDRSQGNFLWDGEWHLRMIDHTRAFGREPAVVDRRSVRRCSRPLWERLQTLDPAGVHRHLEPYLDEPEREALIARREDLVRMLQARIDSEGDSEVLFSYDDPP